MFHSQIALLDFLKACWACLNSVKRVTLMHFRHLNIREYLLLPSHKQRVSIRDSLEMW